MSAALKRIALVGILAAIAGMAARPYAEDLVRSTLALHAIEPCCSLVNIEHETIALFERASASVVEVTTITTSGGGSSTSSIKTDAGQRRWLFQAAPSALALSANSDLLD